MMVNVEKKLMFFLRQFLRIFVNNTYDTSQKYNKIL